MKKIQKSFCLVATSDKTFWAPHNNVLLSSVFNNYKKDGVNKNIYKVFNAFEDNLALNKKRKEFIIDRMPIYRTIISQSIKTISGVSLNIRQEKIVLDLWLFHFLTIVFDRVSCMKSILDKKEANLFYMMIENIEAPNNSMEFINNSQSEKYNQYYYAEAARIIGIKVVDLSNKGEQFDSYSVDFSGSFIHKFTANLSQKLLALIRPALVITSSISKVDILKVFFKSFARVVVIPSRFVFMQSCNLKEDIDSRRNVLKIDSNDQYDEYASVILKKTLPLDLFERFSYYYNSYKKLGEIPIIASDTEQYWNDQYKILAANISMKNGRVDAIQHGGNYNIYNFSINNIESSLFDRFYHWAPRYKYHLPSFKIEKIKNSNYKTQNKKNIRNILFVCTKKEVLYPHARYMPASNVTINLEDYISLYENLKEDLKGNCVFRPHPQGINNDNFEAWIKSNNINVDFSQTLLDSLINSKIIIVDSLSTTWIEILYLNIPLIIIFDYKKCDVNNESKKIFMDLELVKVFHDDYESASEFINSNYHTLDNWWNDSLTKEKIKAAKDFLISDGDLSSELVNKFSI